MAESCPVARLKGLAAACALQRGRVDGAPLAVHMIQSDANAYTNGPLLCKYTLYKGEGHHYWHQCKMQEVGILSQ